MDSIAKAINEAGIRVSNVLEARYHLQTQILLCRSSMDSGVGLPSSWNESTETVLKHQLDMYNKHHNTADGRIRAWFSIRTIFNATDELLMRTKQLADERGVGIHIMVQVESLLARYACCRGKRRSELLYTIEGQSNGFTSQSCWFSGQKCACYSLRVDGRRRT